MERHVISSNRGFTVIEFLVAIVILMVGLLGLLQAVNLAVSTNLANQLRNEAVMIADTYMARMVASQSTDATKQAFVSFSSVQLPVSSARRRINNGYKNYSVARTLRRVANDTTGTTSMELDVLVSWNLKGARFTHNASTVLTKK